MNRKSAGEVYTPRFWFVCLFVVVSGTMRFSRYGLLGAFATHTMRPAKPEVTRFVCLFIGGGDSPIFCLGAGIAIGM